MGTHTLCDAIMSGTSHLYQSGRFHAVIMCMLVVVPYFHSRTMRSSRWHPSRMPSTRVGLGFTPHTKPQWGWESKICDGWPTGPRWRWADIVAHGDQCLAGMMQLACSALLAGNGCLHSCPPPPLSWAAATGGSKSPSAIGCIASPPPIPPTPRQVARQAGIGHDSCHHELLKALWRQLWWHRWAATGTREALSVSSEPAHSPSGLRSVLVSAPAPNI